MSNEKIVFSTNFIAIKETARGYQYLERKGRDSVAIFLARKSYANRGEYEVLVRQQFLCVGNPDINEEQRLYPCPITGGMGKGESLEEAANREVYEESGFSVPVLPLGKYIVGTQTNESCYMYYAIQVSSGFWRLHLSLDLRELVLVSSKKRLTESPRVLVSDRAHSKLPLGQFQSLLQ